MYMSVNLNFEVTFYNCIKHSLKQDFLLLYYFINIFVCLNILFLYRFYFRFSLGILL